MSDLNINIMMVGGRRCGKTSVLAAMQSCFQKVLQNTPLTIYAGNDETLDVLEKKRQEIKDWFLNYGQKPDFKPDCIPNIDIKKYTFYLGATNKNSKIRINFIDYPGELLYSEGDKELRDELKDLMKKSRVLLVAIDTPHMMEEKGRYNDKKNLCFRVTSMIKASGFADAQNGSGMVLFIPLKCERYYNDGRRNVNGRRDKDIDAVSAKVQEAYEELIQYLKKPGEEGHASKITIAITPILTMGSAEFNRFEWGSDGEILIDKKWGTPETALYRFSDACKGEPEPKYCEQPLLYVCSYLLTEAKRAKGNQKTGFFPWDILWAFWTQGIQNQASEEDYRKLAQAINEKLKKDGDGYRILNKGILKL